MVETRKKYGYFKNGTKWKNKGRSWNYIDGRSKKLNKIKEVLIYGKLV